MHAPRQTVYLALYTVLLMTAGCGKSSPPSFFGQTCTSAGQVVLVSPQPGSTGNLDNFGPVVLGSTTALAATFQAYLVGTNYNSMGSAGQQNISYYGTVQPAPSPTPTLEMSASPTPNPDATMTPSLSSSPSPSPAPTPPIKFYYTSGDPPVTWQAKATISVYLGNKAEGCLPTEFLGSFAVQ